MVNWLKSPKHVFWEALLVTILVFVLGIFLGIAFEKRNISIVEDYYSKSEVSMMDMFVIQNLIETGNYHCDDLISATMNFADKIYEEAILLDTYESSNILTERMIYSHKKYDLLRSFVWINSLRISEECPEEFTPVIYLYEYNTEDVHKKAEQNVWSKILLEVKEEYGSKIILIPVAVDNNLSSIDVIVSQFGVEKFPAVVIGKDTIITELTSANEIKQYLDDSKSETIKLN